MPLSKGPYECTAGLNLPAEMAFLICRAAEQLQTVLWRELQTKLIDTATPLFFFFVFAQAFDGGFNLHLRWLFIKHRHAYLHVKCSDWHQEGELCTRPLLGRAQGGWQHTKKKGISPFVSNHSLLFTVNNLVYYIYNLLLPLLQDRNQRGEFAGGPLLNNPHMHSVI